MKGGSVLSRAVDVADVERPYPSVLLYGDNRVGKTTLAVKFDKPLLFVTFEPAQSGGVESIRKEKGVKVLQYGVHFKDCNEAVQLCNELKGTSHDYRWVVVDNATSLQARVLQEIQNLDEVPTSIAWGTVSGPEYRERAERTKEVMSRFLGLNMGRVIIAKEKDHNPPKEERVSENTGKVQADLRPKFIRGLHTGSKVGPDLGGGTAGWIMDACDCIVRLSMDKEVITTEQTVAGKKQIVEVETDNYIRYLRLKYHPNYFAGVRCADPEKVPDYVCDATPDGLVKKLLQVIRA